MTSNLFSPGHQIAYSIVYPKMKVAVIVGTRPEIIKMSPVIRACQQRRVPFFIVHTNQHYTANMDAVFFRELDLPKSKYNLGVGSADHGEQTGRMLDLIENVLQKERPDAVLVQGDTNTVVAGALAASKLGIKVGHVEAGLRSYDRTMPEEINRVVADHISDYLFAPTKGAAKILEQEGIAKNKIYMTGNTVVDAVSQNLAIARRKSRILQALNLSPGQYFLLTLHRPANVDRKPTFQAILSGLDRISQQYQLPIIFPIHPRTKKQLATFNLPTPAGLRLLEPVGYLDFLLLEENARLILTDSGGIQEEACILKVPCVTIRENTERPETVEVGANMLTGMSAKGITRSVDKMLKRPRRWQNPFGDGKAGGRIAKALHSA